MKQPTLKTDLIDNPSLELWLILKKVFNLHFKYIPIKFYFGLKIYSKTPNNGLLLYCGTILTEDGKTEKKVVIDFEPHKPINTSLYQCDSCFHTEPLKELIEYNQVFGFIIVDSIGALYGTL